MTITKLMRYLGNDQDQVAKKTLFKNSRYKKIDFQTKGPLLFVNKVTLVNSNSYVLF
jgi:hypothetical protein